MIGHPAQKSKSLGGAPRASAFEALEPVAVGEDGEGQGLAPGLIAGANEPRVRDPVAAGDEVLDDPLEAGPPEAALVYVPITLADGNRRC